MDEIEKPERHDAGQLVKFSQQEGFAELYRHSWSEPTSKVRRTREYAGLMNHNYILAFYYYSLKGVTRADLKSLIKKIISHFRNYR